MRPCSRLSTVRFATGPKRSMGHVLGTEKLIFSIRGRRWCPWSRRLRRWISCQSLPNWSPWGRLGSVLYTCNRLRRMRRRFNHFWSISLSRPQRNSNFYAFVASRALREHLAAASTAYAAQALTHYQTYPVRPPGADLPPQKVNNLDPMAPRSRQKS